MPQFQPNETKTATVRMRNPTAVSLTYNAELYLGEAKVTRTTKTFSIPAAGTLDVAFTITMPSAEGTYPVFLDAYHNTALIAAYRATEDVIVKVIPAIEVVSITWA